MAIVSLSDYATIVNVDAGDPVLAALQKSIDASVARFLRYHPEQSSRTEFHPRVAHQQAGMGNRGQWDSDGTRAFWISRYGNTRTSIKGKFGTPIFCLRGRGWARPQICSFCMGPLGDGVGPPPDARSRGGPAPIGARYAIITWDIIRFSLTRKWKRGALAPRSCLTYWDKLFFNALSFYLALCS